MRTQRGTFHWGTWQHHRYMLGLVLAVWLCSFCLLLFPSKAAAGGIDSAPLVSPLCSTQRADSVDSISASKNVTYFFPVIAKGFTCLPIPGATYGSVIPSTAPVSVPPPVNPEYNLSLRSYDPTSQPLGLVDYGGNRDPLAPQLYSLFGDNRTATFRTVYQVHKWNYSCPCASSEYEDDSYPVTLAGLETTPNELIYTPGSGYDIGLMTTGYEVMVLYATSTQLTFRYGREDIIRGDVPGYVIHLENICVDPNLLAAYNYWDSAGRGRLPALNQRQPLGRAIGNEIGVAIRDWASFMDPRSRKDWWYGR